MWGFSAVINVGAEPAVAAGGSLLQDHCSVAEDRHLCLCPDTPTNPWVSENLLCSQKKVRLLEFEQATSPFPVEKKPFAKEKALKARERKIVL